MDREERFLNDWPDGTPKSFGNDFTKHWDLTEEDRIGYHRMQEAEERRLEDENKLRQHTLRKEAKHVARMRKAEERRQAKEARHLLRAAALAIRRAEKLALNPQRKRKPKCKKHAE